MLDSEKFQAWANENVLVVVGHGEQGHEYEEEEEEGEDGEAVRRCLLYPGLTCDQHEAAARDCRSGQDGLPQIESKSGVPNSWLVAPTGEIREIDPTEQQQYKRIIEFAEAFQEEVGPHLTRSRYLKYQASLAEGDAALEEGDFRAAIKAYAKVDKDLHKLPSGMADALRARVESLQTAVREVLDGLRSDEGEPADRLKAARRLLTQVSHRLKAGYLPVREEVRDLIDDLRGR